MSSKKQLLDPLGTLLKLIALNFSEVNTKISIQNHILALHKPNGYRFLVRMINGDGRENISELFHAIVRVIIWYLVDPSKNDTNIKKWNKIYQSDEIKKIIRYVVISLKKLQKTYEYGNVVLAIQYYINILNDSLENNFTIDKLPFDLKESFGKNMQSDEMPQNLGVDEEYENFIDYKKLQSFWDFKKLKMITELYEKCFNVSDDSQIPTDEKKAYIDGHLNSINKILEIVDSDFQKLILNNNRG